jgi:taurine transport system permease protein
VTVRVFDFGEDAEPEVPPGDGWAKNDALALNAWRSGLILFDRNDDLAPRRRNAVVAINGTAHRPRHEVETAFRARRR